MQPAGPKKFAVLRLVGIPAQTERRPPRHNTLDTIGSVGRRYSTLQQGRRPPAPQEETKHTRVSIKDWWT